LEGFGIRLNKEPPNITFKKKDKGGINMTNTVPLTHLTPEEVKAVLSEYRINSADLAFRCDATVAQLLMLYTNITQVDDLIDVLEGFSVIFSLLTIGNRVYTSCIYVMNKIDQISIEELDLIYKVPHAGKSEAYTILTFYSANFGKPWLEF
jgi:ribosome-interacting GTPase 1